MYIDLEGGPYLLFLIVVFVLLFLTNRSSYFNIYWLYFLLLVAINFVWNNTYFTSTHDIERYYFFNSVFYLTIIPAILLVLSILTFFSSKTLMEKEGRSLRNLFISLFGVALIGILFLSITLYFSSEHSDIMSFGLFYIIGLFVYFTGMYTSTAIYSLIYNFFPVMYKPDYIIVLGSGLIGDKVPPLLASRLDKAVHIYKKWGRAPLLITSGGKGSDELVAEAVAMKKYMIDKYCIPAGKILTETQSKTTYENMLFSKRIIDARFNQARGIFVSNNFHIYRASIYASKIDLKANGIGARTAFYYLPNAFTREFIGLLEIKKWWHLLIIGLYTLAWVLITFTNIN